MTSPKIMKYWRKNIKNKYLILFELGKIRVFQNCILGPNKCSSCPAYFWRMGKIYFGIFGVRLVFLFFAFLHVGIIFFKKSNRLWAVPERDSARGAL